MRYPNIVSMGVDLMDRGVNNLFLTTSITRYIGIDSESYIVIEDFHRILNQYSDYE